MDKRFVFILIALYVFALFLRLPFMSSVEIGSDNIGPALAAMGFWEQGWAEPPNPESDHWLWLTTAPWLVLSNSIHDLFVWRFAIGALVAPLTAWTTYLLAPNNKSFVSILAGLIVSLDPGLTETLISGFRGYMAPEWIALGGLFVALAIRGKPMAAAFALSFLIIAAGHHPLALGAAIGWLFLAFRLRLPKRIIIIAMGLALASAAFRIFWMWHLSQCDEGGLSCFQTVALGSSEDIGSLELVFRAFYERYFMELGWLSGLSLIGICVGYRHEFAWWTIGLLIGIVVLGLSISTLRPYHMRLAASPVAVITAIGFSILGRRGLILGVFWICGGVFAFMNLEDKVGALNAHDAMALVVLEQNDDRPIWVDTIQDPSSPSLYAGAIVLSAWLRDSGASFASTPHDSRLIFFLSNPSAERDSIEWSSVVFDSLDEAKPWLFEQRSKGYHIGGGHDWAIRLYPPDRVDSHIE